MPRRGSRADPRDGTGLCAVLEVKAPPAGWTLLPVGTPETVASSGNFGITGQAGTSTSTAYKNSCPVTDTETIVNPTTGSEGQDEMLKFEIVCAPNGNAPFPCVAGEAYKFKGALSASLPIWPSELSYPSNDTFENVVLEVECASSASALYHPPGHVWNPKISINALKSSAVSGVFKNGINHFVLLGTDTLAAAGHGFVR